MERIEQKDLRSLAVSKTSWSDDVIRLHGDGQIILVEKQSIPALIDALKKYQE